jgi:L-ascorbate metabolism protein UlaG (beta-lactamase superfamily)
MKLKWLGHATFIVEYEGLRLIIDPFIRDNPVCPVGLEDVPRVDLVLVTHSHADHYSDALSLVKRDNALFVGSYELATEIESQGGKAVGMNIGGTYRYRSLLITQVRADHSHEKGPATGFVLRHPEGSLYHSGDTGLFYDMALIRKLYSPDVALLPIGSHFTMGIDEAVEAVDLLKPKYVIPMHYNTFDVIKADPHEFKRKVEYRVPGAEVVILSPGDEWELRPKRD